MKLLCYQLQLLEPALLTAPGGDPNTDESVDYIPGSVLRGALAHKYRQANLPDDAFSRIFLDEPTRFFNAYFVLDEERTLPTPAHWRREKDPDTNNEEDERRVYDLTRKDLTAQKGVGKPYMRVVNNLVYTQRPQYEVAVHNARNRAKGRATRSDGELFRYHALAKMQTFKGYILLEDGDADTILNLLEGDVWLGGSSSAGYGRSHIFGVQEQSANSWREMDHPSADVPAEASFLVYLTSDALVRDPENGQYGTYLKEQLGELLPGHTLEVLNSYGRFGWVGGFNRFWGLPLPQTWGMLKGSVWQMQSNQAISAADIQRIEQRGIGDRRAEGYGALLILPTNAWPQDLQVPTDDDQKATVGKPRPDLEFPQLSADSANLLEQMNQRIAIQQLDRRLLTTVNNKAKMNTNGLRRLSNSQLARLQMKAWQEKGNSAEKFKRLRQFLHGSKERKSADDQYRKSRFRGRNFREWLLDVAGQPAQIWELIDLKSMGWEQVDGKWQRPLLGEEPFILDDELAHEYTIRFITAICEQAAKDRRTK